ncbi:inhibin beta B chain [Teleopsis dalmanni]|uniref:inhibin beta B chain n=1 Tax=Teleopsis dalmanni TaxID=139649 RepID=UPI0018CE6F2B|nr:inhibin beta B chain [Teleopsis dalmanni]
MAKYFATFILLAILALENHSVYRGIYVSSLPSVEVDYMRAQDQQQMHTNHHKHKPSHKTNVHHHQSQLQQQQQSHHAHHHNEHSRPPAESHRNLERESITNDENDMTVQAIRLYLHQQRHKAQQLQHYKEHEQLLATEHEKSVHESHRPKTEPEVPYNSELMDQSDEMIIEQYLAAASKSAALERDESNLYRMMDETIKPLNANSYEDSANSEEDRMYSDGDALAAVLRSSLLLDNNKLDSAEMDNVDTPINIDNSIVIPSFPDVESKSIESVENIATATQSNLNTKDDEKNETNQPTKVPMQCPKCESNRQVELITQEELTRLRIESVKEQILDKLRLKERPNVSAIGLPKPMYEETTIEHENEETKNKDLDDYYARTSKKFIFLKREKRECQRIGGPATMCFSFKIDDADADALDVNTAVLWIFKNKQKERNATLLNQQTIVVSEVQQQLDSKYLPIVKTVAIKSVNIQDEWLKINIDWPIKRWFGNHELSHLIQVSCQSCDIRFMEEMISIDKGYRPFIMIDTQNRRRPSRQKRGINCTDGVTECCRERLYISFDEIGWGDWIIQPRGYDAYFCRGSCSSVASVAQASSHHSTFIQKVLSKRRSQGQKPLELIPCCTAKQYSSLQLVFMDSNNTATMKTFPNMVIESCGCR